MSFYTLQLRSVDEGSTVFYKCLKCGYGRVRWFSVDTRTLLTTNCLLLILFIFCVFFTHISKKQEQAVTTTSIPLKYNAAGGCNFYASSLVFIST